jgi:hypothetical protein
MKSMLSTRRALGATLLAGAAVLSVVMVATTGRAFSATAAEYQYKPVNTTEPKISGTAAVGQTLTTTTGSWQASGSISYSIRWYRCDTNGNNCTEIAGATSTTYKVTSADNGKRIRSYIYAAASGGTTLAASNPTGTVGSNSGTTTSGGTIAAASVTLPNRLTIDKTQYSQNPIKTRTGTTAKFHVVDANGKSVQGAKVFVLGVPYSRIQAVPEALTDSSGWATTQLIPDKFFPRTGYLVLFVRASVQGQDALGGVSTRRLVQVTIAPPA